MDKHYKKSSLQQFATTVSSGIIGSVLTLGVVFNTNLLPAPATETIQQEQADMTQAQQVAHNLNNDLADMVENASSAIVGIINHKSSNNPFTQPGQYSPAGSGSGVVYKIDKDYAYIVTNNHVIEGAQKVEVAFQNEKTAEAQLVGSDALSDLAVIKVDAKYADNALSFGDSSTVRSGDQVVAIGNPLGIDFSGTVTQGVISAVDRSIEVQTSAGRWELNVLQTDAAINPGNSGGALLNRTGEVIGINSLKIAENGVEGLGFAIPSNEAVPLINEMIEHGEVERAYIGVGLADLHEVQPAYVKQLPNSIEGGTIVLSVDEQSAARKAGLQQGDIITAINGEAVHNAQALRKYLYTELTIGDEATLTIYRDSEEKAISLLVTSTKQLKK